MRSSKKIGHFVTPTRDLSEHGPPNLLDCSELPVILILTVDVASKLIFKLSTISIISCHQYAFQSITRLTDQIVNVVIGVLLVCLFLTPQLNLYDEITKQHTEIVVIRSPSRYVSAPKLYSPLYSPSASLSDLLLLADCLPSVPDPVESNGIR